ncbi:hypothetical protein D3C86_1573060 [compost metagenome]
MRRIHDRFPVLTFLKFAVTVKTENQILVFIQFFTNSVTDRDRQTLTKRARSNSDSWQTFVCGWVALQSGIQFSKSRQFAFIKIACVRQNAVENRRDMTIGKIKCIFIFSFHIEAFFSFHHVKIKRNQKICTTQRTARMTRLAGVNHSYNIPSHLRSDVLKF